MSYHATRFSNTAEVNVEAKIPKKDYKLICGVVLFILGGIAGTAFVYFISRKERPGHKVPHEYHEELVLDKKIRKYVGIPYAVPLTNETRFSRSRLLDFDVHNRLTKERRQSYARLSCPQPLSVPFPRRHISQSNSEDDCLYLNIWQPSEEDPRCGKKPVVVVFYGGRFQYGGGGAYIFYEGKYMASLWDVVVVVPAYRVGVFGFLSAGLPDAPGNVGIEDQIVALQWVQRNINHFGGSPSEVTVLGHEAGAVSVGYHLLLSRGTTLFQRAIMISGSPYATFPDNTVNATANIEALAASLRCTSPAGKDHMKGLVSCLRTRSVKDVVKAVARDKLFFGPSCDNTRVALTVSLRDRLIAGMKPVDIIVGYTRNEGGQYVSEFLNFYGLSSKVGLQGNDVIRPLLSWLRLNRISDPTSVLTFYGMLKANFWLTNGTDLLSALERLFGEMAVQCPVNYFIEKSTQVGSRVFVYEFIHMPYYRWWRLWRGVPQMLDLIYATGQVHIIEQDFGLAQEEKRLSQDIAEMFAGFAWNANPNVLSNIPWIRWEKSREEVLLLQLSRNETRTYESTNELPHRTSCEFWKQFLAPAASPPPSR